MASMPINLASRRLMTVVPVGCWTHAPALGETVPRTTDNLFVDIKRLRASKEAAGLYLNNFQLAFVVLLSRLSDLSHSSSPRLIWLSWKSCCLMTFMLLEVRPLPEKLFVARPDSPRLMDVSMTVKRCWEHNLLGAKSKAGVECTHRGA
eukprot:scaffold260653_cov27-Prasinocladus_malaysianus.AAC.1